MQQVERSGLLAEQIVVDHIAPDEVAAAQKYQYWVNNEPCGTLESFIDGAEERKGSWWPDWLAWVKQQDSETVSADGARVPGKGKLKPIEDAPGSYVKAR